MGVLRLACSPGLALPGGTSHVVYAGGSVPAALRWTGGAPAKPAAVKGEGGGRDEGARPGLHAAQHGASEQGGRRGSIARGGAPEHRDADA